MGYFNIAYSIFTTLYLVATAGLPSALTIMISGTPHNSVRRKQVERIFHVALSLFFTMGLLGAILMFVFARQLAEMAGSPDAYLCIMAIAPTLFFICMSSAIRGYFQGHRNMVPTAISEITEAISKFVIGIVLAYYAINRGESIEVAAAYGILGITIGVATGMIFLFVCKFLHNHDKNENCAVIAVIGEEVSSKRSIFKKMFSIALPITMSSVALNLTGIIDAFSIINLMKAFTTSHIAETAYGNYSTLAVTMAHLPSAFIQPIASSLTPTLTSTLAAMKNSSTEEERIANKEASVKVMHSCLKFASIISIPCAIGMSVLSGPILSLLFKDKDSVSSAAPLLSILSIGVFFTAMLTITTSILQSHGLQRKTIISMYSGVLVKLVLNLILISNPNVGIYGAPIATVLGYFTMASINFYFILKHIGIRIEFFRNFLKAFVASGISSIVTIAVYRLIADLGYNTIGTFSAVIATAIVYFILLLLFNAVQKSDIVLLPKGQKIYRILKKIRLMK
ncbi:MAG: polysaccharide biosynthesis protein [Ruminococcaceae bacterium]|nr:polysaccharide biosynthesis protein [Oscillospiraceae bacterium]